MEYLSSKGKPFVDVAIYVDHQSIKSRHHWGCYNFVVEKFFTSEFLSGHL